MAVKSIVCSIIIAFAVVSAFSQNKDGASRTVLNDNVSMIAGAVAEVRNGDTVTVRGKD